MGNALRGKETVIMNNKNFKVIKHLGMLSSPAGDTAKTVSIIQWGDLEPSLDIRKWENNEPKKGISIRGDEIKTLCKLLKEEYPEFI